MIHYNNNLQILIYLKMRPNKKDLIT